MRAVGLKRGAALDVFDCNLHYVETTMLVLAAPWGGEWKGVLMALLSVHILQQCILYVYNYLTPIIDTHSRHRAIYIIPQCFKNIYLEDVKPFAFPPTADLLTCNI